MVDSAIFFLIFGSVVFFALGAAIGSFLNVVIFRLDSKKDLSGRSECLNCHHVLGVWDLIPIFSYLYLSGKCRYCHQKISPQYPLVELTTALAFTCAYIFLTASASLGFAEISSWVSWLRFAYLLFFFSVLIVLTVFDLKKGIIPDKILFPAILLATIYLVVYSLTRESSVFEVARLATIDLLSTTAIAVFFLFLIVVTKGRGMGGGDFKLSIFIGLSLGWPLSLIGIVLGFLTGAFVAVMLILLGRKGFGQTIPFGPALALGAYLSALFGERLLGLYLKTLGL